MVYTITCEMSSFSFSLSLSLFLSLPFCLLLSLLISLPLYIYISTSLSLFLSRPLPLSLSLSLSLQIQNYSSTFVWEEHLTLYCIMKRSNLIKSVTWVFLGVTFLPVRTHRTGIHYAFIGHNIT